MDTHCRDYPRQPAVTPAWLRFALFCTLFLLAAVWLETRLALVCRATAYQVFVLLGLAGLEPVMRGDLISTSGFSVRIVTECTPLYTVLLYCALVLSRPTSFLKTATGLLLGALAISTANLLRIAGITAAGPLVSPLLFDILHVYLGQVAMLLLVLAAALLWLRWSEGESAGSNPPLSFALRSLLLATAFFIPWLLVNRGYVALLDAAVAALYSWLYPGYRLLTTRPFPIYNHTFAVPLFLALVMADRPVWTWRHLLTMLAGVGLIATWHTLFRITHVIWTAFDMPEIIPLHQMVYLLGQFLLPVLLWYRLDGHCARQNMEVNG